MHTCHLYPIFRFPQKKLPKISGSLPAASHQASSSVCHWPRRPPSRAVPHRLGAVETAPGDGTMTEMDGYNLEAQQDGRGLVGTTIYTCV